MLNKALIVLAAAIVGGSILAAVLVSDSGNRVQAPAAARAGDGARETPPDAESPGRQPVLTGFAGGSRVEYLDFGRIRLRPGNDVADMWVVRRGAGDQRPVLDSVPGEAGYSALRRVSTVVWKAGTEPRLLRSADEIRRAAAAGLVTVGSSGRVVNAPVLGHGQTAHEGFARGGTVRYYELGQVNVAPGNEVLPIWTFTNGVEGQLNVAEAVPGATAYPPLWQVVEVTWRAGSTPRAIRSLEELRRAEADGEVSLQETDMVVNCPFV